MSDDLLAFIRSRLDEREQPARFATSTDESDIVEFGPWADPETAAFNAAHITANNPAYVLADIAAKRRIVDAYTEAVAFYDAPANRHHPAGEVQGLRTAIAHLALPFAAHPDYCDEWRP